MAQGQRILLQCRRHVQALGLGDPLEEEMATHSSFLAWRIPWTEEPSELQSMSCRVWHDWAQPTHSNKWLTLYFYSSCISFQGCHNKAQKTAWLNSRNSEGWKFKIKLSGLGSSVASLLGKKIAIFFLCLQWSVCVCVCIPTSSSYKDTSRRDESPP